MITLLLSVAVFLQADAKNLGPEWSAITRARLEELGHRVVENPSDSDCVVIVRSFSDLSVDIVGEGPCRGQLHIEEASREALWFSSIHGVQDILEKTQVEPTPPLKAPEPPRTTNLAPPPASERHDRSWILGLGGGASYRGVFEPAARFSAGVTLSPHLDLDLTTFLTTSAAGSFRTYEATPTAGVSYRFPIKRVISLVGVHAGLQAHFDNDAQTPHGFDAALLLDLALFRAVGDGHAIGVVLSPRMSSRGRKHVRERDVLWEASAFGVSLGMAWSFGNAWKHSAGSRLSVADNQL